MQVGTTKDQGLYNKPSAAMHPGALAAGTLPQYNNEESNDSQCVYKRTRICASRWFIYTLQYDAPYYNVKLMIYTSHDILLGCEIEECEKGESCSTHG